MNKTTHFTVGFVVLLSVRAAKEVVRRLPILLLLCFLPSLSVVRAELIVVTVPGTSDPWLAGMPAGATASSRDVAPNHSPVEVPQLTLSPGIALTFDATGGVLNSAGTRRNPPDGVDSAGNGWWPHHNAGAENGIGNVNRGPGNALMGVFLGPDRPDLTPPPPTLNFQPDGNVFGGINYTSFSPKLKQVFFIGDGRTNNGVVQQIFPPQGATRLFLGTMDSWEWSDNVGAFEVTVHAIPEPSTLALLCIGALGLMVYRLRRRR